MQTCRRPTVRAALAALVAAALDELADRDGTPIVDAMPDHRRWWRYGQESFVALRPSAWHMPARVPILGWLDQFPQMTAVLAAINADPVMGARVDTSVGVEFSLHPRPLAWLLIEHLLEPMVVAVGAYRFDEAVFNDFYQLVEAGLLAEQVRLVEFVPLLAFTVAASVEVVPVADGLVLRPMTDLQVSAAIQHHAVPAEFAGGPNSVRVSRFHQWALTSERTFAVCSYKLGMPKQPKPAPFPSLRDAAGRLATALRIICGGSAIASRPLWAQHDDEFPLVSGTGATLSTVDAADFSRPTLLLTGDAIAAVRETYEMLGASAVVSDGALQTALRRLVFAGSSRRAGDRLVDLMICAEALFIKRAGTGGNSKRTPLADAAGRLLAGDLVIAASTAQITAFLADAYQLRNDEMHGDDPT